jgi:hypothetical protein
MIDLILFSFFVGTAYVAFRAGAKYHSFKNAWAELKKAWLS